MSAALALTRRGHRVTVLEAFDEPRPLGSGLLLQPSGLAALKALGLHGGAMDLGAPIHRLEGRDVRGYEPMRMAYGVWRPGAFGLGMHRAALFGLLYDQILAEGVEVRTGATIESFDRLHAPTLLDGHGVVHGPFDLVVVADGSASTLRDKLKPRARCPVYPWGAVWANAADPSGEFSEALRQRYEGAAVMIGILPIGRTVMDATSKVSFFWSLRVAELAGFQAADLGAWRARVLELWPEAEPIVSQIRTPGDLSPAIYRDVSVGRWDSGSFVLIGDAAHGTSPQLGQGANLGLLDGVELALNVDRPARAAGFQARRRLQTGPYQLFSRLLTPLFQSGGRLGPWVRRWLFAPLAQAPGLNRIAAAVLTGVFRLGPTPPELRP
jgi:2-polyprenyl-6-methoxyphenol hydroxylase-like FAD-dependent oxidoreductase